MYRFALSKLCPTLLNLLRDAEEPKDCHGIIEKISGRLPDKSIVFGFVKLEPSYSASNQAAQVPSESGDESMESIHQDRNWNICCEKISSILKDVSTKVEIRFPLQEPVAKRRRQTLRAEQAPSCELVFEEDDGESMVLKVLAAGTLDSTPCPAGAHKLFPLSACASLVRAGVLSLRVVAIAGAAASRPQPSLIAAAVWVGPVEEEIFPAELDSDALVVRSLPAPAATCACAPH